MPSPWHKEGRERTNTVYAQLICSFRFPDDFKQRHRAMGIIPDHALRPASAAGKRTLSGRSMKCEEMSSRPCKLCLSRINPSIMKPSASPREAHLFMILTVSSLPSLPTGSAIGDFLPNKHYIVRKQLGGIFSGIHPKIPLMQAHMFGQGRRIRGMMKALLP